nr:ORF1 [Raccoon dog Torque teno virus 1]
MAAPEMAAPKMAASTVLETYAGTSRALPRRKRLIVVTGWEILGVLGSVIQWVTTSGGQESMQVRRNIKTDWTPSYLYKLFQGDNATIKNDVQFKDFCGGYGTGAVTLEGLILRNLLGMNRFSDSLTQFHWIRFIKGHIQLVPNDEIDWLFRVELHRPGKPTDVDAKHKWNHPAVLINLPGTKIVESIKRSKCCRWKHIKFTPPTHFEGWYDLDNFSKYPLFSYMWTSIDLSNPMGMAPYTKDVTNDTNAPLVNKWWGKSGDSLKCPWIDRKTYNDKFINDAGNSWLEWLLTSANDKKPKYSPFNPPVFPTTRSQTLWFRYKLYFQIGGLNINTRFQGYPVAEYESPPPAIDLENSAEIQEEDLDESGQLREEAFRRIAESHLDQVLPRELRAFYTKLEKQLHSKIERKKVRWGIKQTRRFRVPERGRRPRIRRFVPGIRVIGTE